jgi:hypothetical protein
MPPIMGEVLDLAYNDPAVGMIIVDRVISRNIFHLPDLPDPTPETIRVLNGKRHPKPTVFSVDSEGGDPEQPARWFAFTATTPSGDEPASDGGLLAMLAAIRRGLLISLLGLPRPAGDARRGGTSDGCGQRMGPSVRLYARPRAVIGERREIAAA